MLILGLEDKPRCVAIVSRTLLLLFNVIATSALCYCWCTPSLNFFLGFSFCYYPSLALLWPLRIGSIMGGTLRLRC